MQKLLLFLAFIFTTNLHAMQKKIVTFEPFSPRYTRTKKSPAQRAEEQEKINELRTKRELEELQNRNARDKEMAEMHGPEYHINKFLTKQSHVATKLWEQAQLQPKQQKRAQSNRCLTIAKTVIITTFLTAAAITVYKLSDPEL